VKILSIGPISPFRGGIAKFHQSLNIELSKSFKVEVLNFKKLYPSILFPGKSQFYYASKDFNSHRILKFYNIFTWFKGLQFIKTSRPDYIIFHYWHWAFLPMFVYLSKKTSKIKKRIILHNVLSHESIFFEKLFVKILLKNNDEFIVMNNYAYEIIKQINPSANVNKIYHPIYNVENSKRVISTENTKAVLFFGLVRKYKGLDILIEAMDKIDSKIQLLVVGEFYDSKQKYLNLIKKLNLQERVKIFDSYIAEEKIQDYFNQADLVVLPYKKSSQSGVLSLAYHFDKPVLVTDSGGLVDYVLKNKTGLISKSNPSSIAEKINLFFSNKENLFSKEDIRTLKHQMTWENFVDNLNLK
jgi:glycosyltransferase involved in cell wall biosynthesis